jgi:tRNA A-37 threonylcarbamoyl transferase component Bud32
MTRSKLFHTLSLHPEELNFHMQNGEVFLKKKNDRVSTVGILDGNCVGYDEALLIKRFNYRGWIDFFKQLLYRSRAKNLWQRNSALYEKGLPVPKPIDYSELSWQQKCSFFISSVINDSEELGFLCRRRVYEEEYEMLFRQLAGTLAKWHMAGAVHGDLKWFNILVQKNGRDFTFSFVDLDRAELNTSPCIQGMVMDLRRMYRSGKEFRVEKIIETVFFPAYLSCLSEKISKQIDVSAIGRKAFQEWHDKGRLLYLENEARYQSPVKSGLGVVFKKIFNFSD